MNFKTLFLAAAVALIAATGVQAAEADRYCFCRDEVTSCYSDCAQSADGLRQCLARCRDLDRQCRWSCGGHGSDAMPEARR
ncbi:hypothetical protein HDV05_006571 [Chytridiales sp. JEL 0842]|nr:hypothetical protein HDV05_006571 [Chytridiales sp. JEL 0842]